MGYKLAGFDVIGCNEIDPKMMAAYVANHAPKYSYLEPIQTFKNREDLPPELFDLDILDGSPPCSSFSMAGNREQDWGKEKKFREGQAEQVLDTLFFDFIDLAERLQPKVVVAENVKGLLLGNAIHYVRRIYEAFDKAGYYCQHFLLDASKMGVPQRRERVFFVCIRKDLAGQFMEQVDMFTELPKITMEFEEAEIPFGDIQDNDGKPLSEYYKELWSQRKVGDEKFSCINDRVRNKPNTGFSTSFAYPNVVCDTLTAKSDCIAKFEYPQYLSDTERCLIGTFPLDYKFTSPCCFVVGMSVPPVMTANVATEVYNQWLSKLK